MAQDAGESGRDQLPLKDVVLCSTSLPQDARIRLADTAQQMGATHKLDLTGEVTHLIVGDQDTAKYKYVAKERPDIAVLDLSWIDAVREAWMEGGDVDVEALEKIHRYPTFSGLKICITGISDQAKRSVLASTIEQGGAEYHGDLTKQCTHLLVAAPEGAKFKAAKDWRIHTVSLRWLQDSVQRGMALEPKYYDPTMSEEDQGKGAYRKEIAPRTTLGKRSRNAEPQAPAARRKLKRHASRRLEDHSQDMWQDISAVDTSFVAPTETDQWTADDDHSQATLGRSGPQPRVRQSTDAMQALTPEPAPKPRGIFSGWRITVQGFDREKTNRVTQYLEPNGAQVVRRVEDLEMPEDGEPIEKRCLLVPHIQPSRDVHITEAPSGIITATEWWVERCLHCKQLLDPEEDPLSQPLWNFSILGFSKLTISTTGFSGVDFRQVAEAIKLAGAVYQPQLGPNISLLISGSSTVKKEKAYYASKHRIPVVTADWLWSCLKSKRKASVERFKIELPQYDPGNASGHASNHSPATMELPKRSSDAATKRDKEAPARLSNTRKRQTTPSLPLQARKSSPKATKATGPFVHEDDDEDDNDNNESAASMIIEDSHITIDGPEPSPGKSAPLQSISSNASPRRPHLPDRSKTTPDHEATTTENTTEAILHAEEPPLPEPEHPDPLPIQPPVRAQADWAADLKSLVDRQQQQRTASSEHQNPAQRLKHRKLGRAASGSSFTNRTNSGSGSTAANQDAALLDTSFSESADSLQPVLEDLPSTQIGYETPEAEAARLQMAKRMGTTFSDEGAGTRLAGLGTVKDSSSGKAAAGGGAGRARNRAKR